MLETLLTMANFSLLLLIVHYLRLARMSYHSKIHHRFCTLFEANCISWSVKKQPTVPRSSTEAEYRAMAITAAELTWLSYLLQNFGILQSSPPVLYCDNLSALYFTINRVFHARTKHVEIDYHYVREKLHSKNLRLDMFQLQLSSLIYL